MIIVEVAGGRILEVILAEGSGGGDRRGRVEKRVIITVVVKVVMNSVPRSRSSDKACRAGAAVAGTSSE